MVSLILHGRSSIQLQKWGNLRFLVQNANALSNSFSSATASGVSITDGRKGKTFKASSLVDSERLAAKLTTSVSRKVRFNDKGDFFSVMSLFKSYGFTDSQISDIIRTVPRLLIADSEKSLGLKLQFLQSRGASTSELTEIVSKVPKILGKTGDRTISLYYDFIKEIIEADKSSNFKKLCQSLPQGKQENKLRNVSVLRELGVPQRFLFHLLISNGGPINGKEKFDESLKKVVEMGFDPTTSKFVDALRIIQGFSDKTLEEKVNVYERLGFAVEDVWVMFKKFPMFMGLSEKKVANSIETFTGLGFSRDEFSVMIKRFPSCLNLSAELVKKKTEFLVREMNWPLQALVITPQVLGYSLEKRTVPRCNVIKSLMSKGLLGDGGNELPLMQSVLKCTNLDFLNRYVTRHDDKKLVAELMAIYTGDHAS